MEPWQQLFTFYNLDACLPENPKSQLIQVQTEMLGPAINKSEGTKGGVGEGILMTMFQYCTRARE